MKKAIPTLCLLACVAFQSCSEQQTDNPTPTAYIKQSSSGGNMRVFYILDGDCYAPARNCLPEVIVQPPLERRASEELSVIENNPEAVGKYFKGKAWSDYFVVLNQPENAKYLNKLRSGKYNMLEYNSEVSGKKFYLFSEGKIDVNNPEIVIPVNAE